MALGSSGRRIVVEFIGDASALKSGISDGEKSLQGFGGKAKATGAIAGKVLAGGLLLAGVAAVKATQAAADDQAAQSQLAQQLRQAAGASDAQIASTEDWITKQGKATGITDDELRPALARLATATGSVSKAQKLAALAMDVSAGSGKSYQQVTEALAKAQNGNIGALGRLGVATKDASGKTMSLTQVTQLMADKYNGAAAKAAETTAGKQKILTTQMGELQEQIGANLLPVMVKLSEVGLQVVNWISKNTTTAGVLIGVVGGLAAVTWGVGAAISAWTAVTKIAYAAQVVFTNAQWALNIAMEANPIGLVVVALAALVGGLIFAYKHSETFRNIVDKTFGFIKKVVPAAIGTVVNFVKAHWGLLVSIIGGPLGIIAVQVVKHFGTIKSIVGSVVSWVVGKAKDFGRFTQEVGQHIRDAVKFFVQLPGKITGALASLPGQLVAIGGHIIDGLVNGIQGAASRVESAVQSIINKIPSKIRHLMGISSPSKVTKELGGYIGDGLADGIASKKGKVDDATKKLIDTLTQRLQTLMGNLASVRDSVSNAFTGDLFQASATDAVTDTNGVVTTPAMSASQNFLASLTKKKAQLSALSKAFKTLIGWGWKPQALSALFQSGNADLILELASNKAVAQQAAGLYTADTNMSAALGGQVGNNVYGDQIAQTQAQIKKAKGGGKGGKGDDHARTININVNTGVGDPVAVGREVERVIRRLERASGRQLLVARA